MIKIKTSILLLFIIFLNNCINAQDKSPVKFGKITPADFDLSKYTFDSSAAAVVIADIGDSHYEGSTGVKGLRLVFTHYKRIKILKKSGFDIATVNIPFYTGGTSQQLFDIKASTYNIENGRVAETKLDGKSIFTETYVKNFLVKKFTFPSLNEGSIIEYSYTFETGTSVNLFPWNFQGKYPCLWSEYSVSFPEIFDYVTLAHGENSFYINTSGDNTEFGFRVKQHRWVMKDVPGLSEESYTSTINNYISKIEFQLASISYNGNYQSVLPNWPKIIETLMKSENFGLTLNDNNGWLDEGLKTITLHTSGKLEKAEKIYDYVRDNFNCTQYERLFTNDPLKTIYNKKSGNEAEINLLLCAMLNHENIHSDPIILSTRNHGFANQAYPAVDRFNYVICDAIIDSTEYFLDASHEFLRFNSLPEYCYNGQARVINKENPDAVYFIADSLKETKLTSVFITNDDKQPLDITGNFQSNLGFYESYKLREKLSKTTEKEFFKDMSSSYNTEVQIENAGIDSLKQLEYPVAVHFDFSFKDIAKANIIYFNPFISESLKENPFKSAERKYPVEMPYTTDETYVLDMEIPKGYAIDEIPRSAKLILNGTDGFFEYIIDSNETNIHLRSRIKLNKATFQPEDYTTLRDFFTFIVKKQSEQIVFKKKK